MVGFGRCNSCYPCLESARFGKGAFGKESGLDKVGIEGKLGSSCWVLISYRFWYFQEKVAEFLAENFG